MPGIQFLGTRPEAEEKESALAKVLKGAAGGLQAWQIGRKEEAASVEDKRRWEEEIDLKRSEMQYKLKNLDQSKLVQLVNTMNRIVGMVDKDRRAEMLDDPEIQAVYDAAGIPLPRSDVEVSPWEGTSWLDRAKAAATPWATEMEEERWGLRPGGVFAPPVTRTRPPTPRSRLLPPTSTGALPEGVTEDDVQYTMKKHGLTREQVLQRLGGK